MGSRMCGRLASRAAEDAGGTSLLERHLEKQGRSGLGGWEVSGWREGWDGELQCDCFDGR